MKLDTFLRTYVSGYLLGDLRSMERFRLPRGRRTGALGYPMVMSVAAGIELLGSLSSPKPTSSHGVGIQQFGRFWREWMYPNDPDRRRLADTVYLLGRHGIAHAFVAKPRILVTRLASAKQHHLRLQHGTVDTLVIDAPTLARDFRRAYRAWRAKLRVDSAFRSLCEARLLDIEAEVRGQSASQTSALRKTPIATAPLPAPRVVKSGHINVNSPSANPTFPASFSTWTVINQSTKSPK